MKITMVTAISATNACTTMMKTVTAPSRAATIRTAMATAARLHRFRPKSRTEMP